MNTLAYRAVCLMVFVITWENVVIIEQVGTITKLLGPLVALVVVLAVLYEGAVRAYLPFHAILVVFFCWGTSTYLWSVDPESTLATIPRTFQLLVLVLILWQFGDSRERLRGLYVAYVVGAGVSALLTVHEFLRSDNGGSQRWAAPGFNPNHIALIMCLGIPIAWYLFHTTSSLTARILYSMIAITAVAAVVLTGSRTGAVLLTLVFLYLIVGASHLTGKLAGFVAVIVLVGLVTQFTPRAILERYGTIGPEIAEGSPQNRAEVWQLGVREWLEVPIHGVGFGAYRKAIGRSGLERGAHNTFLSILVEQGVVGLSLFLVLLGWILRSVLRLPREDRLLQLTLFIILVGGLLTINWEIRKQLWLILSLMLMMGCTATSTVGDRVFMPSDER